MASAEMTPAARRSFLSSLAHALASGFGSGHSPVAPGTAGSVVGLLLFVPLSALPAAAQLAASAAVFVLGVFVSSHVARQMARKDPGVVVIDEVVGVWVTLLFLPFTPATACLGFLLFRLLDMVKPYPARQLEALPGGLGIMADDVMAAVYANLVLRVVGQLVPLA